MKTTPLKKIATVLGAGSLLLGAVAAAPAASAATPAPAAATGPAATGPAATGPAATGPAATGPRAGARTALVAAWYQHFLGRDYSADAGSRYWIVRLRTEPYDQVLADFLRSPEYVTAQVTTYYQQFLGRGPDSGASYWTTGVEDGSFPLEWVEQNVLSSPEHVRYVTTSSGADARQAIQSYYGTILRRLPSPEETDYWASRLAGPLDASFLRLVREIWYTPEGVDQRTANHYSTLLDRTPSGGELAYWAPAEKASDIGVTIAIATSEEYRSNSLTGD